MAEGKVVISAQNRIKEGLDAAQRDLSGFEGAAKKVGETLKNAFALTAIIASVEKLGRSMFDAYKEFGEGERRANALSIALDNNALSIQKATSLIDTMARRTLASKDDVEALVAELAALGKSDAEIESITTAAVNLANVTGKDLNSAFALVNATYSGTTGKLAQLLPEIGNLTEKQLAAGEATKLINDKFSELSRNLAENDIPQKLKNIEDGFGDMKENIGRDLAPIFNPFLEGINSIITAWNSASQAAMAHRNLLLATSPEQKKALNQQLIEANNTRKEDLANKLRGFEKSVGQNATALKQSQQYQAWMAEYTAIIEENIKAQKMVDYYTAEIEKAKGKVTPEPLVKLMAPGATAPATTGTTPPTGKPTTPPVTGQAAIPASTFIPSSADDFYLFMKSLGNASAALDSFGVQAEGGTLALGGLADEIASPVEGSGIYTGQAAGMLDGGQLYAQTIGSKDVDGLSQAMVGAIDAGITPDFSAAIAEFKGSVQYQESVLLNFVNEFGELGVYGLSANISEIMAQTPAPDQVDTGAAAVEAAATMYGFSLPENQGPSDEFYLYQQSLGQSAAVAESPALDPAVQEALASNIAIRQEGPLEAFATNMLSSLGPVIDGFMGLVTPLASVQAILNPLNTIFSAMMEVLAPIIDSVLQPVIGILRIIGMTLGAVLAPVLEALSPVIQLVTEAFVWLYNNAIQPVANAFIWVGNAIYNAIVAVVNWIKSIVGGTKLEYRSMDQGYLEKIDISSVTDAGESYTTGASTASQSANYRTQSITINIYQNAPMVGSGGMDEFVQMIRTRFNELAYFGATA